MITGAPGAGKTTIARLVADRFTHCVHLHADDFWHFIRHGAIALYLPESHRQNKVVIDVLAHAACGYATGGYEVICDGVIGPWFLDAFRAAARNARVELHYLVLRPDQDTTLRRATSRTAPDALIDPEPIRSLHQQLPTQLIYAYPRGGRAKPTQAHLDGVYRWLIPLPVPIGEVLTQPRGPAARGRGQDRRGFGGGGVAMGAGMAGFFAGPGRVGGRCAVGRGWVLVAGVELGALPGWLAPGALFPNLTCDTGGLAELAGRSIGRVFEEGIGEQHRPRTRWPHRSP